MIYDTIEHLACYRGLHANLDCAIDYLLHTDLSTLPVGKHAIDGDKVYLMIQEPEFRSPANAQFEIHRRYADLQLALAEGEAIAVMPIEKVAKWGPFNETKDIGFSDVEEKGIALPMASGTFMILFPQDAHMPNLRLGTASCGRKAVIKILL